MMIPNDRGPLSSRRARFPFGLVTVSRAESDSTWCALRGATAKTMADSGTERALPSEDMPRLGPTWSRGGGMFKPPKRPQGDTDGVRPCGIAGDNTLRSFAQDHIQVLHAERGCFMKMFSCMFELQQGSLVRLQTLLLRGSRS